MRFHWEMSEDAWVDQVATAGPSTFVVRLRDVNGDTVELVGPRDQLAQMAHMVQVIVGRPEERP